MYVVVIKLAGARLTIVQLPNSDIEIISAVISALGGQWSVEYTRKVTHLLALTPTTDRYRTAQRLQRYTKVLIVTPHWYDDAVLYGVQIPTAAYEWPDPAVLRRALCTLNSAGIEKMKEAAKQTLAAGGKDAMFRTARTITGRGMQVQSAWDRRRILLSASLELGGPAKRCIEAGVERAGGIVVKYESNGGDDDAEEEATMVEEADVLVTRYRAGEAYIKVCFQNSCDPRRPLTSFAQAVNPIR